MKDKVRAIISNVEEACSDMAYEQWREYRECGDSLWDRATGSAIKDKQLAGVRDIPGSLTDDYYNDPEFCEGILGDQIYDMANGKPERIVELAKAVKEYSHKAMREACDTIIRRWER